MSGHLVIMAAGTGGHIMPGLAVARQMQARGWTVSWLGTGHGMENRLVPPSGIALDTITFSGIRGKGLWHTAKGLVRLALALPVCWSILRRRAATAVLGMGGYVCFPGGLMTALLGKPLMLMNADAALLLSNRSLLRFADKVAFGFAGAAARQVAQGVVTGNPVRAEIAAIAPPQDRLAGRSGPLKLLVVGGSLGAQAINQVVPAALLTMPAERRPTVVHQTGAAHLDAVRAAYQSAGIVADVRSFIDDMASELADCDLILCRAGAITVSELAAAGVASILVPLVVSTTSHQRDNAQWLAAVDGAIHLPQTELTPARLASLLGGLTRTQLLELAIAAKAQAMPDAAARVADEIEGLVR